MIVKEFDLEKFVRKQLELINKDFTFAYPSNIMEYDQAHTALQNIKARVSSTLTVLDSIETRTLPEDQ